MTTRVYSQPIEPAQRKAIFAAARAKGLSIDDIRATTPEKSISKLTSRQAYDLLQLLNKGTAYDRKAPPPERRPRGPRRQAGMYALVTAGQREMIAALRMEIGWSDAAFTKWLSKRHYRDDRTRPMTDMESSADAERVIELLKGVLERQRKAQLRAAEKKKEEPCPF